MGVKEDDQEGIYKTFQMKAGLPKGKGGIDQIRWRRVIKVEGKRDKTC